MSKPKVLPPDRKLYLAFGSNLSPKVMRQRAPGAIMVKGLYLKNVRLVFRGVADLAQDPDGMVAAGLWSISAQDEETLDLREGVGLGCYAKFNIKLEREHVGRKTALVYIMAEDRVGIFPPSAEYAAKIRDGYRAFKLKESFLNDAIAQAFEDKFHSEHTRSRRKRQKQSTHMRELVKIPDRVLQARAQAEQILAEQRRVQEELEALEFQAKQEQANEPFHQELPLPGFGLEQDQCEPSS